MNNALMFYNRFKKMILMLNQISKEFKIKLYKYILLTQIIYLNLSFQKEFQIELNFGSGPTFTPYFVSTSASAPPLYCYFYKLQTKTNRY